MSSKEHGDLSLLTTFTHSHTYMYTYTNTYSNTQSQEALNWGHGVKTFRGNSEQTLINGCDK